MFGSRQWLCGLYLILIFLFPEFLLLERTSLLALKFPLALLLLLLFHVNNVAIDFMSLPSKPSYCFIAFFEFHLEEAETFGFHDIDLHHFAKGAEVCLHL